MRILIVFVVLLFAAGCERVEDGKEANELMVDKNLKKSNEQNNFTEVRKLAGKDRWEKYADNPVLKLGENGDWDSWSLATMNVLKVGDTCHMYYEAGGSGLTDYQIGHAISTDGINWVKDPVNPVIPFGEQGEWDDKETWDPFVIYEDGIFKMWYGGTTLINGKRDFQIGYTTSTDGTNFTKREQISHYAGGNMGDMHVVHDETSGKYYMYYLDRNFKPSRLLRAESPNEIDFNFDDAVQIEVEGEETGYRCPHVFTEGGVWYMYYGYKFKNRAGYATSGDGLHWTAQNTAVIDGHDPEILKLADSLYLLFYCPTEFNMGHEPGSDIRVAIFEGSLNQLASSVQDAL